ncbi:MAG: sensor histidine kinase [Acidobacteria bacterium]|nr:sensor histidine kinase [Acidobacteriota bacterium]
MRPTPILMLAGSLVWAISGVAVARALMGLTGAVAWTQLFAWLAFGVAFFSELLRPVADFRLSLAVQTLSAVGLVWAPQGGAFQAALLVVVAGQLPAVFSFPTCFGWIAVQTGLAFAPRFWTEGFMSAAPAAMGYSAFQLFAVGAAGLAESERRARLELARAKGRLEAMQERLAETTREAERLRIARELHDTLGHHLTALGLDLEVARHLATGAAAEPVQRARQLVSSLMASVRDTVTELREDSCSDLAAGLRALERPGAPPLIVAETDAGMGLVPQDVSLALLRVAQEIVTNTVKHARAATLRLTLRAGEHGWTLEGRDDGAGAGRVCPGHGLSGMRERIQGLGGTLTIDTSPGGGFAVTAFVPRTARR